jgi:hypothetical protein
MSIMPLTVLLCLFIIASATKASPYHLLDQRWQLRNDRPSDLEIHPDRNIAEWWDDLPSDDQQFWTFMFEQHKAADPENPVIVQDDTLALAVMELLSARDNTESQPPALTADLEYSTEEPLWATA